jgi:alpha-beta hydrolase superfamily lysophospholipase
MLAPLIAAAALAAAQPPAADFPVQIGQGPTALHGALVRPEGQAAPAAVLMVPGSGPGDRDGDDRASGEHSRTQWWLAQALAAKGIVSLRYDKRGSAESAGAGAAPTLQDAVEEAASWARLLARQPGVRCVVALGHSEGALIGALLSHKVKLCGLIDAGGSGMELGALIEEQTATLRVAPDVAAQIHAAIEAERAGRPIPEVPKGYDRLFGPKGEPYIRSEIGVDPVAEVARVKVPVLVVQGDNDFQVKVEDARRLATAAHVQPVIIAGMNHNLKLAPADIRGNYLTYLNPNLPLAPGVADAITAFVLARR